MSQKNKGIAFHEACRQAMQEHDPPLNLTAMCTDSGLLPGSLCQALAPRYKANGALMGVSRDMAIMAARRLGKPDDYFDHCINISNYVPRSRGKKKKNKTAPSPKPKSPQNGHKKTGPTFADLALPLIEKARINKTLVDICRESGIPRSSLQVIQYNNHLQDGKTLRNVSRHNAAKLAVYFGKPATYFDRCINVCTSHGRASQEINNPVKETNGHKPATQPPANSLPTINTHALTESIPALDNLETPNRWNITTFTTLTVTVTGPMEDMRLCEMTLKANKFIVTYLDQLSKAETFPQRDKDTFKCMAEKIMEDE